MSAPLASTAGFKAGRQEHRGGTVPDALAVETATTDHPDDRAEVNDAYSRFLGTAATLPARVALEDSRLPRGAAAEVDAIVSLVP